MNPNIILKTTCMRAGYRCVRVGCYVIEEHRHIMQKHLGRLLEKWEQVHHINGNILDNRIENLTLTSKKDHWVITRLEKEVTRLREENRKLNEGLRKQEKQRDS